MKVLFVGSITLGLLLSSAAAQSQSGGGASDALPSGFASEPVLKSTTTADGDPLQFPTGGKPEIVSVIGTLEPGGRTARHQHPVPVFVYVLEGELEVQTEGEEARQYKTGQAFIESMNHWHQAFNNGSDPAKILVVFMGQEGQPTSVAQQ